MARIYISYSRQDSVLVDKFWRDLERAGHTVFIDKQLPESANWADIWYRELQAASVFMLFVSQESLQSKYVQQELSAARELRKTIIPIRLSEVSELPDALVSLHMVSFVHISEFSASWQELLEWLKRVFGDPNQQPPTTVP